MRHQTSFGLLAAVTLLSPVFLVSTLGFQSFNNAILIVKSYNLILIGEYAQRRDTLRKSIQAILTKRTCPGSTLVEFPLK